MYVPFACFSMVIHRFFSKHQTTITNQALISLKLHNIIQYSVQISIIFKHRPTKTTSTADRPKTKTKPRALRSLFLRSRAKILSEGRRCKTMKRRGRPLERKRKETNTTGHHEQLTTREWLAATRESPQPRKS